MGKVTESIFSGKSFVIPMALVSYVERDIRKNYEDAIFIVMNGTTWNAEIDYWNNAPWLRGDEAESFMQCWCQYRAELEADDIMDISGGGGEIFPGTKDQLNKLGA